MFQSYTEGSERNRKVLSNFGGLNANEYCEPQEMRDMLNLSGDAYPYLTQRAERTEARHSGNLKPPVVFRGACMHNGKLAILYRVQAWQDNNGVLHGIDQLWYDGECKIKDVNSDIPEYFREQLEKRERFESTLLSNGAEILIFPEGISYNTELKETTVLTPFKSIKNCLVVRMLLIFLTLQIVIILYSMSGTPLQENMENTKMPTLIMLTKKTL